VKNFRETLFFRASAGYSKLLNNKKYIFGTVNSGNPLFFRASASCSKIQNAKSIFHTTKNFWATLFFRASASCSKIHNDKKHMFKYSKKYQGNSVFQGKRMQIAQKF